jgi:DNA polymerase-3 subunit beta
MNLKPVAGKDGDKDAKAIEACGLNGHQFSMVSFLNDDLYKLLPEAGVLIQKKYIAELKKWLTSDEIELAMGDKRLFFRTGDKKETFSLPLSYYQYPDYHSFLARVSGGGAGNAVLDVSRPEMVDALERISIFNTDNNRCTYFSFPTAGAPGETVLHSQGQDTGTATESIESVFAGELPRIAFPTRNLIEILSHFGSDKVRFTLSGSEGPCGITGESDPEYLVVIMPMKIVEETYYSEEEA